MTVWGAQGWLATAGVARSVALSIGLAIVAAGIGVASAVGSEYAILIALGVLALAFAVIQPVVLIALAVPASLMMARVGGALSVSDVVLAATTVLALIVMRGRDKALLRPLIWAGVAYLAAALPTTILHPYSANIVEWVHELVLVLGSMIVGFAIGRSGRAYLATTLYVIACVVIAIVAAATGLMMLATQGSFGPVYLPDLHKNLIGGAMAVAIVMLYARPVWFRWPWGWTWIAIAVCGVGLMASQSRQGMVGAVAGLIVVSLRRRPETGRFPKLPWIAAIPVTIAVLTLVDDQLSEDNQFNSAYQRLDWYAQTLDIWRESPIFGVGLRWWYTDRFNAFFQPPNAELEVLSSVGVVGLIGFLAMFLLGVIALWRLDPAYGTVGVAVVVVRFVQAQFDLYWVAGQASLLWIIAGICVGALALARASAPQAEASVPPPSFAPSRRPASRRASFAR
jgi:O-antigen ligase